MKRPNKMTTVPEVFIIESLHPEDEGNDKFEGVLLSKVLRLHKKSPEYRYVRTRKQFIRAIKEFAETGYRYLHISAHGDRDGLCTTNQNNIDYKELAELLSPYMEGKRLFISSCEMVHKNMAAEIIAKSGCLSVIGPTKKIGFSDSAVIWASVYHIMFSIRKNAMGRTVLVEQLNKVCELFQRPLAYYSKANNKRGYTKDWLSNNI